jgi:hypothetical protein
MVDDLAHLSDVFSKPKIRMVLEGKKLLINSSGIGFCPFSEKHHKIIEVMKRKDYNFPTHTLTEKDIKITKWEGGRHWYVKVGQHQLDDKFNTYDYAFDQGKKFLNKIKRKSNVK